MDLTITVVMPALNEERDVEAAISNTLSALETFHIEGDIIVVNDGSTDRTTDVVQAVIARDPRVSMITHARPMGIGASFWDGVDRATGDIVTMFPGDNENDPYESLRYFPLLEHVDMVIPFVFNKEVRSLFRNTLSFVYRFIINTTFLVYFNYTNGTVLYRTSILRDLPYRSTGFFFQTDILVRTVKQGYLFAEVPYRLGLRASGVSKAVSFPSLLNVIRGYARLVRDIYFSGKAAVPQRFTADSQSQKRYNDES
jgi:glycosyltransferase involved in cell wall biosynthesis